MMEQRFWKYKTAVSGGMMGCGVVLVIIGIAALIFGIVFAVKGQVQKPVPVLHMEAGKTFRQKLPEPIPGAPIAIVFENTIDKEMVKGPFDAKTGSLPPDVPLNFVIDVTGGKVDEQGNPVNPLGKTTFAIPHPHMERGSPNTQWRLSDDDAAKFGKFYPAFIKKQPPDPDAEANDEHQGQGLHYAWICGFWGIVLIGLSIVLKRFDPDAY